ncbi:MAG: hypothetical protein R2747_13125 [Pyrinomonadaceae bacterium]
MKNRSFCRILPAVIVAVLSLFAAASAQQGIIQFDNGVTVAIKTETIPPGNGSKSGFLNIYSGTEENVVHRIMTDIKNKIYFGYDLQVEPLDEGRRFRVFIKPLSKDPAKLMEKSTVRAGNVQDFSGFTAQTLPKYPDPVTVEDGDTISLDLLENPQTKVKIADSIKIVGKSVQGGYYFLEDERPKDFTIDEVMLKMEMPEISINGKTYKTRTSFAGNINWVYIYGKGRFIFSFTSQPGYNFQKIGTIENNKLLFDYNGDHFEFASKTPILGAGGKWNLWVMYDPNYQPEYKVSAEEPFIFGAAGSVDYLFKQN